MNPCASQASASLRPPHLALPVNKSSSTTNARCTQRILQLLLFFLFIGADAAVLPPSCTALSSRPRTAVSIAVSNISCTPCISLDEHSMYIAPIFSATARPCCCVTGVRPCVLRSSMQVRLLRRSDFRPQRMIGVVGQKWRTSGYHWRMLVCTLVGRLTQTYFVEHVLQRVWTVNGEADEEKVCLRV